MASTAARASDPPSLFNSDFTFSDRPKNRLSHTTEDRCSIEEEDENASTASETTGPRTPSNHTSESHSFSHGYPHEDGADEDLMTPTPATKTTGLQPPCNFSAVPVTKVTTQNEQRSPIGKPRLGNRVSSFLRSKLSKLHLRDSLSQPDTADLQDPKATTGTNSLTQVNAGGSTELQPPTLDVPRASRRLSSFSIALGSIKSSRANSPPTSRSPTSTLSAEQTPSNKRASLNRKPASTTALSSMGKARPGIVFTGSNSRSPKKHVWSRRRSAELTPRVEGNEDQSTVGMLNTFSKAANNGVGMKARRLSLHLPEQYAIDWCEIDKEFKSSSIMPGKQGKIVGKGSTAEVRVMARKDAPKDEELVAVKIYRVRHPDETEQDYTMKIKSEYSIAKSLHHPNIVETVRLCTNRDRWNHVMEFCAYGELFTLVERGLFANDGFYSDSDRLCFFKQLLRGVSYLHSHGIAHRDIKLENLLLDKSGHLKISDFGVAEVFSGVHPGLRASGGQCGRNMGPIRLSAPGVCGSLPYIAPEVLEKKNAYDPRPLDIWSCAITFLTMTFSGCPWQAAKPEYEYYARFKKGWDAYLEEYPDGDLNNSRELPRCGKLFTALGTVSLKRLMLGMLHPMPAKRMTIEQVMKSYVVKGIECCTPESHDEPECCVDVTKVENLSAIKRFTHNHIPPKESKTALVPIKG